jgi:hypothetical protein
MIFMGYFYLLAPEKTGYKFCCPNGQYICPYLEKEILTEFYWDKFFPGYKPTQFGIFIHIQQRTRHQIPQDNIINLLKPTAYVMHQQFNLLNLTGYVIHQQFNLFKPTGYVMHQEFNLLKPTGYVMHQQFHI